MANEIKLSLENNPYTKLNAKSYIQKLNDNTLTEEEIQWGVNAVDSVLNELYSSDKERKGLKAAGFDPVMGVLIDGKPLDWTPGKISSLSKDEITKLKCEIVAKALQGAKIDVIKYKVGEKRYIEPAEARSVITEEKMEKKSWFRKFLEAIGLGSSTFKKIKAANNAPRNPEQYLKDTMPETAEEKADAERFKKEVEAAKQTDLSNVSIKTPEKPQMASVANRLAVTIRLRNEHTKQRDMSNQFENDFFGNVAPKKPRKKPEDGRKWPDPSPSQIIGNGLKEALTLTSISGGKEKNFLTLNAMDGDRVNSHNSLAILFAMTKGKSFEQITAPENIMLRRDMGELFIKELGSQSLDDFAASKGLDKNDPETKKQYQDYFIERKENIEMFYAKAYDALMNEDIVIPDPNNYNDFIKNSEKVTMISALATDLKQSWDNLKANQFDNTNEADNATHKRFNILTAAMQVNLTTLSSLGSTTRQYRDFLSSPEFANLGSTNMPEAKRELLLSNAAQAKATLQYMKESSEKMNTFGDLIKDTKLCATLAQDSRFLQKADADFTKSAYNHFLCTDDPKLSTVIVSPNSTSIAFLNKEQSQLIDIPNFADTHIKQIEDSRKAMEGYNKVLAHPEDWYMSFGTAVEGVIEDERKARGVVKPAPVKETTKTERTMSKREAEIMAERKAEREEAVKNIMDLGISRENAEKYIPPLNEKITFNDLLHKKVQTYDKSDNQKQSPSKEKNMGIGF